jgi:hypothetical protein
MSLTNFQFSLGYNFFFHFPIKISGNQQVFSFAYSLFPIKL